MTEQNMLGLSPVFNCKNSHPRGDIVFVHGLAGHPWGTWHPESKKDPQNVDFWPFWLGEELQASGIDVNVWSFGYDAPRFGYVGQGMPRFDLASNLLAYLEVHDIGDIAAATILRQRPLIFVTHSMGGLVVKDLIRTAQNFDDKKAIIEQTQGIVFLSTPHQGSHLASLIDNINVLTKATVNVEELRAHSPQLRQLNEWYRQNVEKLRIKTQVFYETQPMSQVLVVDEDSANPGIKDVKPVAIPANHSSIAKPRKNDLVYLSVKKVCHKIFTFSRGEPTKESLETTSFSGKAKIKFCRRLGKSWLDLADYFEIPEYDRDRFQQGYECQEILEWLRQRNQLNNLKSALDYIEREDLVDLTE